MEKKKENVPFNVNSHWLLAITWKLISTLSGIYTQRNNIVKPICFQVKHVQRLNYKEEKDFYSSFLSVGIINAPLLL